MHYSTVDSYLSVNGQEIFLKPSLKVKKFETGNKNVYIPSQFFLRNLSNIFSATESREVSLDGNLYDFLGDYNPAKKSDILNIQKYLMT